MAASTSTHPLNSSTAPRVEYNYCRCKVFSYPSIGGIAIGYFTSIELWLLGISPAAQVLYASQDSAEEDTFALRMLQHGARWWPSHDLRASHPDSQYPYGRHYPPDLHVGYPSTGGVLLLKTFPEDYAHRTPGENSPEKPAGWARLSLCHTMDQRCDVLRSFGAVKYESLEECCELPKSLEEGVAEGRRYEELLSKMEDHANMSYFSQWLSGLWGGCDRGTVGIQEFE
ncbi:hypothetical protein F5Y04DRAFT_131017 [Hypomontagnella monticulosa]|nr:hypothetical protein F5Y04DRAFT_131017 [Hypomontagnella monticulosa]